MMRSPNDPAVRRFIRRSMTVRIATLSPAGNPDIIPLWFVTFRGRVYMGTRSENPTVRDLMKNPEVVLLFHGENTRRHDRVLRMRGHAAFKTGRRALLPIYAFSAFKYILAPGAIRNGLANRDKMALNARYKNERTGGGGVIEVIPLTAEFLELPS